MSTLYGIISDIHTSQVSVVQTAVDMLKAQGAKRLVFNGDLVGDRSGMHPQEYFSRVLECAGTSGLESYVLYGSHEELAHTHAVMNTMRTTYGNLHDTMRDRKISDNDHHVVFLPGSDVGPANMSYHLDRGMFKSGVIAETADGPVCLINMQDVRELATEPEKTIVFAHIPPYFNNLGIGVDRAVFGRFIQECVEEGRTIPKGSILPASAVDDYKHRGYPVELKEENVGNKLLRLTYDQTGITKAFNGHIHEAVHRAHDWNCELVAEGTYVSDLFWNASYLDGLKVGLLEVDGTKVRYKNVDLSEYIKS